MKEVFVGLAATVAINLAPMIETIGKRITALAVRAKPTVDFLIDLFQQWGRIAAAQFKFLGELIFQGHPLHGWDFPIFWFCL